MDFSIVTPSFRNSAPLKLCIPSVADQEGLKVEHIVQDACSDDGTLDWLLTDQRVRAYAEKDAGMYDAVNRGLRKSTGQFLAYINCDEQYLPGALSSVKAHFDAHPDIDVIFSHMIVVDVQGNYICHRKVLLPLKLHTQVCSLPVYTCSMFWRRSVIEDLGLFFDTQFRDCGDVAWVLSLIENRVKMGILPSFTSTFTDSGENMNLLRNAANEARRLFTSAPRWLQKSVPLLLLHHRLRRLLNGAYRQAPFNYAIYTPSSPAKRVLHQVSHPSSVWKTRLARTSSPAST